MWLGHDTVSLAVKIAATASIVVVASIVAERSGPFWGALVATLPVVSGPIYIILALETDVRFVSRSALDSFAAAPAIALYLALFAWMAPRFNIALCLAAALATWFAAAFAVSAVHWTVPLAVATNTVIFALCLWATDRAWRAPHVVAPLPRRWYDIPARAAAVAIVVAIIAEASRAIGPVATGIAAVFPISLSMFALVVHVRLGGAATAIAMASAARTFLGIALALLVLHLAASAWESWIALSLALTANLAWSAGVAACRQGRGLAALQALAGRAG